MVSFRRRTIKPRCVYVRMLNETQMWYYLDGEEKNYCRCWKWNLHFFNPLEWLTRITIPKDLKKFPLNNLETASVRSENRFTFINPLFHWFTKISHWISHNTNSLIY
jgi:hypothetical protein